MTVRDTPLLDVDGPFFFLAAALCTILGFTTVIMAFVSGTISAGGTCITRDFGIGQAVVSSVFFGLLVCLSSTMVASVTR